MNNVRPFVLAAVLLLLFLSTQSDWQHEKNGLESRRNVSKSTGMEKQVIKEKVGTLQARAEKTAWIENLL